MTESTNERPRSARERQLDAMLKEALSRPVVRDVMEVFGNWQRADSGLDAYRSATKEGMEVSTTDHANVP